MLFASLNRSDAEKVFISVRNITGATVSAGAACEWDVVTATDGNAVTAAKSASAPGLFAGIMHEATADSAYGLLQVYGFRQSAYVSTASGANGAPGDWLRAVSGILMDATYSGAAASGAHMVSLMETVSAISGMVSTYAGASRNIFIRAM